MRNAFWSCKMGEKMTWLLHTARGSAVFSIPILAMSSAAEVCHSAELELLSWCVSQWKSLLQCDPSQLGYDLVQHVRFYWAYSSPKCVHDKAQIMMGIFNSQWKFWVGIRRKRQQDVCKDLQSDNHRLFGRRRLTCCHTTDSKLPLMLYFQITLSLWRLAKATPGPAFSAGNIASTKLC